MTLRMHSGSRLIKGKKGVYKCRNLVDKKVDELPSSKDARKPTHAPLRPDSNNTNDNKTNNNENRKNDLSTAPTQ